MGLFLSTGLRQPVGSTLPSIVPDLPLVASTLRPGVRDADEQRKDPSDSGGSAEVVME